MYDNIGGKIKGLAKAGFIIGTIAYVLMGMGLMATDEGMIPIGLLFWVIGPLLSWVSSWLLYGFGELIDKVSSIELNTLNQERKPTIHNGIDSEGLAEILRKT